MRAELRELLRHLLLRRRVVPRILRQEADREPDRADPRDDAEHEGVPACEREQAARHAAQWPGQSRCLEGEAPHALLGCAQAGARPGAGFAELLEPLVRLREPGA